MTRHNGNTSPKRRIRGVTLIELMVAITMGLLLAVAASSMFVSTQRISKVVGSKSQQQETAAIVLDFIGRDLKNAGFFPATFPTDTASGNVLGGYTNVVDTTKPAYDQGVFGCSNGVFDAINKVCPSAVSGAPDSLVVNYFSSDNFTIEGVGNRRDCLRQSVEGVSYNVARTGTGATSTSTVALPVFISNVYSLGGTKTLTLDNQQVNTRSFRCGGNGNLGSDQPLFAGVEELRFTYGTKDATTLEAPSQFYSAASVSAMPLVTLNGESRTGWQRVVAVQVCIVTKTLDASARQVGNQGSYVNCSGTTVNYSNADRSIYQRHVRIYGLRNNLTATF